MCSYCTGVGTMWQSWAEEELIQQLPEEKTLNAEGKKGVWKTEESQHQET